MEPSKVMTASQMNTSGEKKNARMVCQVYTVPSKKHTYLSDLGRVQANLECFSFTNVAGVVFKKKTNGGRRRILLL